MTTAVVEGSPSPGPSLLSGRISFSFFQPLFLSPFYVSFSSVSPDRTIHPCSMHACMYASSLLRPDYHQQHHYRHPQRHHRCRRHRVIRSS